jgi:glyoxylase I family protein
MPVKCNMFTALKGRKTPVSKRRAGAHAATPGGGRAPQVTDAHQTGWKFGISPAAQAFFRLLLPILAVWGILPPMNIEHFAFQVADPVAMADWYVRHLGMKIERQSGPPTHTHFLADGNGTALVEIYHNAAVPVPDYAQIDPLLIHLAFVSADPEADTARLVAAGATVAVPLKVTPAGDHLVMLRDPFGFPLQLCQRQQAMGRKGG